MRAQKMQTVELSSCLEETGSSFEEEGAKEGVEDTAEDTVWLLSPALTGVSSSVKNGFKANVTATTPKHTRISTIEVRKMTEFLFLRYFFLVCNTFLSIRLQLPYHRFKL